MSMREKYRNTTGACDIPWGTAAAARNGRTDPPLQTGVGGSEEIEDFV